MSLHRIRDSLGPGLEPVLGYLKYEYAAVPLNFAANIVLPTD